MSHQVDMVREGADPESEKGFITCSLICIGGLILLIACPETIRFSAQHQIAEPVTLLAMGSTIILIGRNLLRAKHAEIDSRS